jgi:hypothetical protein
MATLLELPGKSDEGQHVAVRASGIDKDPHPPFPGEVADLPLASIELSSLNVR